MLYIFIFIIFIVSLILLLYKKNSEFFFSDIKLSPRLSYQDILDLKKGQKIMTNMFIEFNKICKKYKLKYWCRGGTLIGAVRHQGWVPWDGDIDVGMMEEDLNKFSKVVENELPKNMWFQSVETDKYWKNRSISKIRSLEAFYKIKFKENRFPSLQLDIMKFKYVNNGKEIYGNTTICGPPDKTKRSLNDVFPLKQIKFDNINVYVPNKYKQLVKEVWGGYPPELPPINKRFPHEGRISFNIQRSKLPRFILEKMLN